MRLTLYEMNGKDSFAEEGTGLVIAAFTSNKLDTYMYFSWDNGVKGSKGRRRRKGG